MARCRVPEIGEDCMYCGPGGGECGFLTECQEVIRPQREADEAAHAVLAQAAQERQIRMAAYLSKFPDRTFVDFMLDEGEVSAETAIRSLEAWMD